MFTRGYVVQTIVWILFGHMTTMDQCFVFCIIRMVSLERRDTDAILLVPEWTAACKLLRNRLEDFMLDDSLFLRLRTGKTCKSCEKLISEDWVIGCSVFPVATSFDCKLCISDVFSTGTLQVYRCFGNRIDAYIYIYTIYIFSPLRGFM